jgi:hypothetical protein
MTEAGRRANAKYLATMSDELCKIAEQNGFALGSQILRMACLEFMMQYERLESSPAGRQKT